MHLLIVKTFDYSEKNVLCVQSTLRRCLCAGSCNIFLFDEFNIKKTLNLPFFHGYLEIKITSINCNLFQLQIKIALLIISPEVILVVFLLRNFHLALLEKGIPR